MVKRKFHVRVVRRSYLLPSAKDCFANFPECEKLVFLDSSNGVGNSVLAWSPDHAIEGEMSPKKNERGNSWPLSEVDPGVELERACHGEEWSFEKDLTPIGVGWHGWMSFECGHAYESFPWTEKYSGDWSDYFFGRYRQAIVFLETGEALLLYAFCDDLVDGHIEQVELFEKLIGQDEQSTQSQCLISEIVLPDSSVYQSGVEGLRAMIAKGELYQANLSAEFQGCYQGSARSLYLSLRAKQPTSYSCFWDNGEKGALISNSPECFLKIEGNHVITKPIKGTILRSRNSLEDFKLMRRLQNDDKEIAELNMIVDMARNDLGRIAKIGQVSVKSAGELISFPTLHHRVATVSAKWDTSQGIGRIFAATFPPASITGAPKVRALQAIADIENRSRGPYCGTFGYWLPGKLPFGQFSVLIRTVCFSRNRLRASFGAGIVWDSNPEEEWEETLLKSRYLRG